MKKRGCSRGCFGFIVIGCILLALAYAYGLGVIHGDGLSVSDVVATAEAQFDP